MVRHDHKPFQCEICQTRFARKDTLKRHSLNLHSSLPIAHECLVCGIVFRRYEDLIKHRKNHQNDSTFHQSESALQGTVKSFNRRIETGNINVGWVQEQVSSDLLNLILNELNSCLRLKVGLIMRFELAKQGPQGEITEVTTIPFRAKSFEAVRYGDHREELFNAFGQIKNVLHQFNQNGSSWIVLNILEVVVQLSQCRPLNGLCGDISVLHPKKLCKLKINNTSNTDCFYKAIAAHFTGTDDNTKNQKFIDGYITKLNHDPGVGMEIRQIKTFEEKNENLSVRINVLGDHRDSGRSIFYPMLFSKNFEAKHTINLVLINLYRKGNFRKKIVRHYLLVDDLQKLIRQSYRGKNGKALSYQKTFPCLNCFQRFSCNKLLKQHEKSCQENDPAIVSLMDPSKKIQFCQHNRKFKNPFIGFLDLESKSVDPNMKCNTCGNTDSCPHKSVIEKIQTPISYCLIILDLNNIIIFDRNYVGDDCISDLNETLFNARKFIGKIIENQKPLVMTASDEKKFMSAKKCHICERRFTSRMGYETFKEFEDRKDQSDAVWSDEYWNLSIEIPSKNEEEESDEIIVRDHCHINGNFIGAAHQVCNLNRRLNVNMPVPIYCHNFSGKGFSFFLFFIHLILYN